jgi:hypothetical protein
MKIFDAAASEIPEDFYTELKHRVLLEGRAESEARLNKSLILHVTSRPTSRASRHQEPQLWRSLGCLN